MNIFSLSQPFSTICFLLFFHGFIRHRSLSESSQQSRKKFSQLFHSPPLSWTFRFLFSLGEGSFFFFHFFEDSREWEGKKNVNFSFVGKDEKTEKNSCSCLLRLSYWFSSLSETKARFFWYRTINFQLVRRFGESEEGRETILLLSSMLEWGFSGIFLAHPFFARKRERALKLIWNWKISPFTLIWAWWSSLEWNWINSPSLSRPQSNSLVRWSSLEKASNYARWNASSGFSSAWLQILCHQNVARLQLARVSCLAAMWRANSHRSST